MSKRQCIGWVILIGTFLLLGVVLSILTSLKAFAFSVSVGAFITFIIWVATRMMNDLPIFPKKE